MAETHALDRAPAPRALLMAQRLGDSRSLAAEASLGKAVRAWGVVALRVLLALVAGFSAGLATSALTGNLPLGVLAGLAVGTGVGYWSIDGVY